jgi:prefoldin alpha subunit
MMQQQLEQLTQHVEMLQQHMVELEESRNALVGLGEVELQSELLAPIANGIFVRGVITNNTTLLVNVGSGAVVEKSVAEVITLLDTQKKDLALRIEEAQNVVEQLSTQSMKLYGEVEQYVR